jgi:hypothetical protein
VNEPASFSDLYPKDYQRFKHSVTERLDSLDHSLSLLRTDLSTSQTTYSDLLSRVTSDYTQLKTLLLHDLGTMFTHFTEVVTDLRRQ